MVKTKTLVKQVRDALAESADPQRQEWAKTNCPTRSKVLGVKVPDIRIVVNDLTKKLKQSPIEEVIGLSKALVVSGYLECQHVAYELLSNFKAATYTLQMADLEALGQNLDNWGMVDGFAVLVAGPVWREKRIPDDVIRNWAQSKDRWRRRVAVVCTVALNQKSRGGKGDVKRTLDICRRVVGDQDEMVIKALSWALRELTKREIEPVMEFLKKYGNRLPARVKREVTRKIQTGRK